jgi:hypothetical protein
VPRTQRVIAGRTNISSYRAIHSRGASAASPTPSGTSPPAGRAEGLLAIRSRSSKGCSGAGITGTANGPFKTVVDTLERIEAAYTQRYGQKGPKWLEWEGFMAEVIVTYVVSSCSRMKPAVIEREMWERYETFMEAEGAALYGDDQIPGLLKPLHDFEDAMDRKRERLAAYRSRVGSTATTSKKRNKT